MNAESPASPTASSHSRFRNFLVGTWLLGFCYVGMFYIVICTIAAFQVQERVREVSGDPNASGPVLIAAAEDVDRRRQQDDEQRARAEQSARQGRDRSYFWGILDPLVQKTGLYTGDLYYPRDYDAILDSLADPASISARNGTHLDGSELDRFFSTLAEYRSADEALREQEEQPPEGERGSQSDDQKSTGERVPLQHVDAILAEIDGLKIGFVSFALFVSKPDSVLVFFLAIAMGALGSTIHLTRAFLAGESRPMAWYLIRPLLGTVTAVAMYILAKAGQLALNPGEAVGAMDPWFISFLAVISGLMSEDAVQRISDAGRKFFETTSRSRPDRWGLNLGQKMAEAETDRAPLAAALGVPASRLDSWIDASEAVPAREQNLIAAWLKKPVRELFSDMKPPRASRE